MQKQNSEWYEIDRIMVGKIERDICSLYNQLAEYNQIEGDLNFSDIFNLPYWEFLAFDQTNLDGENFVRDGCLIMILSMAWDYIQGSGNYIKPYISLCKTGLSEIVLSDEKTTKLVNTVKLTLEVAEQEQHSTDELEELSMWVHKNYVEGYFRKIVYEFDNNPIYKRQTS